MPGNSPGELALLGRDVRQRSVVPPERLAACHALVVGVGAVGRQLALQLAAVGVPRLTLFDDDHVAAENLAPQGYWAEDLGLLKVQATAALCRRLLPTLHVEARPEKFRRATAGQVDWGPQLCVFAAVDSIGARRMLWEALHPQAVFWADGRLSAEVVRVIALALPEGEAVYPRTLFAQAEAYVGSCTARATVYAASIAAGLMVAQWAKWLRGLPVEPDLSLNLLAAELTPL